MASCSKRGKNGSLFTPKRPHFVRVILNEIMKNQKISIPRSFLRIHGKSLSKTALLIVPSGAKWKVELLKHEDEVAFEKGWEKFMAYYSIDYGDFLVFEYEGNSLFNVFIIDKSFTEVDYPWNRTEAAESNQEENFEDPEDNDVVTEIVCKLSSDSEETGRGAKGKEKLGCSRISEGELGVRLAEKTCPPSGLLVKKPPLADLKPGVPRFTVQMRETHLPPRSTLNIPAWFARKYFKETEGNVTLTVLDGGSWSAMYCTCGTRKGSRIRFQGWSDFARDNCLAVDNICSFDLLKAESYKVIFQVTISRPNQHSGGIRSLVC